MSRLTPADTRKKKRGSLAAAAFILST